MLWPSVAPLVILSVCMLRTPETTEDGHTHGTADMARHVRRRVSRDTNTNTNTNTNTSAHRVVRI